VTPASALDLSVRIGSAVLSNPTIAASGCYNRGAEFGQIVDVSRYGAVTLKTVTREPRLGNSMPRITSTPSGMLNAIGLQGPGIEHFMNHEAPKLASVPTAVIASVGGFSVAEFAEVAARMDGIPGVVALELDVSCPNVDSEGECFAESPSATAAVVEAVKKRVRLPVIAKLTPNISDIKPVARAAESAGADALSLINSVRGIVIDTVNAKPVLANATGGVTGPAIRPIGVYMVWEASRSVRIPIIGMGGIETGGDALEYVFAGASAIAIGTANFRNPLVVDEIVGRLAYELRDRGLAKVSELVGMANPGFRGATSA
jgi:dihydroorotate dehydrogenase (NAD+) catalytic subunit